MFLFSCFFSIARINFEKNGPILFLFCRPLLLFQKLVQVFLSPALTSPKIGPMFIFP